MFEKSIFYRMMIISMGCLIAFLLFINLLHADSNYSATIQILQNLYKDELQAFHNYRAYARKAESENPPIIMFARTAAPRSPRFQRLSVPFAGARLQSIRKSKLIIKGCI
jgi:hypothetical protein